MRVTPKLTFPCPAVSIAVTNQKDGKLLIEEAEEPDKKKFNSSSPQYVHYVRNKWFIRALKARKAACSALPGAPKHRIFADEGKECYYGSGGVVLPGNMRATFDNSRPDSPFFPFAATVTVSASASEATRRHHVRLPYLNLQSMNKWVHAMVSQRRVLEAKVIPPWVPPEKPKASAGSKRRRATGADSDSESEH